MTNAIAKYVPPSISETAFNCPHCGALAKQDWFNLRAQQIDKDGLPQRITEDQITGDTFAEIKDKEQRERMLEWAQKMVAGAPFIKHNSNSLYQRWDLFNANLSRCFNCNDIAIWVQSALVHPVRGDAPLPNPDLPDDVRLDFDEAGRILRLSPRGAAALLRLAIQKLCAFLGEKGKHIDTDIASLVKKGLDPRIQQALDVVRVIGNNAVHPGQVDLRDDVGTAEKLFDLVNIIADAMISQPKRIAEMFDGLPQGAREAIAKRDGKGEAAE
jgi:hypothetical protein